MLKKAVASVLAVLALIALASFVAAIFAPASFAAARASASGGASMESYPHYLKENDARYRAYRAKNPAIMNDMVIAYVNANVDKGFYNEIETIGDPGSISVLVNKSFKLPEKYVPEDLVFIDASHRLREEAAEHFLEMRADMKASGLKICVLSAYRTYQAQTSKHDNAARYGGADYADKQFARPGHSEHQTGLAIDVLQTSAVKHMAQARFENTPEYEWLTINAYKYGFILRYPEEFGDIHGFIFEPWHWRYVGVDIATTMYYDGIVMFEEYCGWNIVR